MKALIYTGAETLEYGDAPTPPINEGEALVRVMASGVCGSDMHAYLGHDERRPAPLILGHEAAGIVAAGPEEGRRITFNPLVSCGTCHHCRAGLTNLCASRQIVSMAPRQGAFAEYVTIPHQNLITVPENVAMEHAALTEPLACGWHGVRVGLRTIDMRAADVGCLVIGGGAIGFGAALCLGAQDVTDITLMEPNADRRAFLQQHCDFNVISPEALDTTSSYDLVIDGVGFTGTREVASNQVRPGGAIIHIGLGDNGGGLDIRRMTLQEITFIGTYTYTLDDFQQTAEALFDGRFGNLDWVNIQPLSEGERVFKSIRSGDIAAPKTVLIPAHDKTEPEHQSALD
jgi:L-gulonate 5-dehydrogenase